jgi:tight adherence protein B
MDILIFLVVAVSVVVGLRIMGAEQRKLEKRIQAMQTRGRSKATTLADLSLKRKTQNTSGLLSMLAKPLPSFQKLGVRLERADIKMSPKQYALRRILWVIAFMVLFSLILRQNIMIGFVLGFILGVWLPLKWMQRGINKRNKEFLRLFPDAIDLIVRGLRSGLPVSESIVLVSTEVPQPVGGIFATLNNTMKLGVPLEKALQEMAKKLDLTEFNFFCTSIILQRETGGNLSEILNNLSEVLRGRFIMGMKIKAMSSEARASAIIIGSLPFFVIAAISIMTPSYLKPMIDDYRGNIAAAIAACMMIFGGWIMNRMTKFEI